MKPRALHIVEFFRKTTHLRAHYKALSKWESQWERNSLRVAPDLTSLKVLSACWSKGVTVKPTFILVKAMIKVGIIEGSTAIGSAGVPITTKTTKVVINFEYWYESFIL